MKRIVAILALIFACHASFADTSGDWTYTVSNNQATITGYTGAGGAVTIPSSVNGIPVVGVGPKGYAWQFPTVFGYGNQSITSVTIQDGVTSIGASAFSACVGLTNITIPTSVVSIGEWAFHSCQKLNSVNLLGVEEIGFSVFNSCTRLRFAIVSDSLHIQAYQDSSEYTFPPMCTLISASLLQELARNNVLVDVLANNDTFVTAVANKIKATGGNYGIATQSELSSAIEPLATKTQITTAINEGRAAGIASVTASPNTWSLFTSSQIQNMAIGDLVLTREVNGNFVLNYDIEQSNDLTNWTVYSANTQIVKLPADKAFVRIKAKQ